MKQKCIIHNVILQKVVLRTKSPPEIWLWRFRSKQAIVRHNVRYVEEQLNCTTENIDFKNKLSVNTYIRSMKNSLNSYFENLFFSFMHSDENKKLCTYKYVKNMFCIEPFLKCIRKGLTCF